MKITVIYCVSKVSLLWKYSILLYIYIIILLLAYSVTVNTLLQ